MKVIGVGNDSYICEVGVKELALLLGHSEAWEIEGEINAGIEIPLERAIRAAKWIRGIDTEHFDRTIKELQLILTGVERVKVTASTLNLFNRLGDTNEDSE